ncbi:MAG: ribonuclease III domain-containing protein [Oscillospiraceae bacterium]|nr:ribonuclease III domain-containing protein [Oscillospiraceae bacterium]
MTLAFLGDAVYELEIRRHLCGNGSAPSGVLHKKAVHFVCAAYQAKAYDLLSEILNEAEMAVMKRGRNANSASVPKSSSPIEYRKATGVESLFGYLHLKGEQDRINDLIAIILDKID